MMTTQKGFSVRKALPKTDYYVEEQSPIKSKFCVLKIKEKLFSAQSEYQKVEVFDTYDFGRMLVLDDSIQTTESDEFVYHEVLTHPPLVMLPKSPKTILVIGGGDGGSIEEICKHKSIEKVVQVELDKMVVEASSTYLPSISKGAFSDKRVEVVYMDGRKFVEMTTEKFDAVSLDLTDPIECSKYLYTKEFYSLVAARLNPGGIVALHGSAWWLFPKVTAIVYNTLSAVFPYVRILPSNIPSYGMELAFMYASKDTDVAGFNLEKFSKQYKERLGTVNDLKWIDSDFLQVAAPPKLMKEYLKSTSTISTDSDPFTFDQLYPWDVEPLSKTK